MEAEAKRAEGLLNGNTSSAEPLTVNQDGNLLSFEPEKPPETPPGDTLS
jgi:hypothetical protein